MTKIETKKKERPARAVTAAARAKPRRAARHDIGHAQYLTKSEKETFNKAREFGRTLVPGDVVALTGELGSGKSVFTRGMLHSLGIRDKYLASPTFTLINMYRGAVPVYHFDVYRLEDPRELDGLGYEEFFFGDGVAIVEWADKVAAYLPPKHIRIALKVLSENGRLITIDRTCPERLVVSEVEPSRRKGHA